MKDDGKQRQLSRNRFLKHVRRGLNKRQKIGFSNTILPPKTPCLEQHSQDNRYSSINFENFDRYYLHIVTKPRKARKKELINPTIRIKLSLSSLALLHEWRLRPTLAVVVVVGAVSITGDLTDHRQFIFARSLFLVYSCIENKNACTHSMHRDQLHVRSRE